MHTERSFFLRYGLAVAVVVLALCFRMSLIPILGGGYPILVFFPAIMIAGAYGGVGPGILATALSVLVSRWFFVPPVGTLMLPRPADVVALSLFAIIGLLMTYLNQTRANATRIAEESVRSLQASQVKLQAAYDREKRIAETLQRSLLMTPAETQFEGLSVEAFYEAANTEAMIGGDFFDAFALSGNRVALVVGDVSGKGLQAATHTAEIKYALRAILREHPHPATALVRLNNVVCESQELDKHNFGHFIAVCLAVIDPRTGEGQLSMAGSEPPLIIRRRAGVSTVEELGHESLDDINGLPLCVEDKFLYNVRPLQMDAEDTFLMLTDGITEARRGREFLGYDGMIALARQGALHPHLREMGQTIIDGARSFAGGKMQDDACLLLARRRA